MRRVLLLSAIVLSIGVFALAVFYPNFIAMAGKDYPGIDDPDMPAFMNGDYFKDGKLQVRLTQFV